MRELSERIALCAVFKCPFLHLTNGWYHSSHEVKSAGEVPSRSDCVHADPRHVRLLVVPEEVVQVFLAQVVLLAEMLEPLRPALLRFSLLRLLQRGEDGGPAKEVDDDEQSQQQEPRVILVYWTGAAAATAPTCHYVAVVTAVQLQWGTCGMVVSNKTHSPRRKRWQGDRKVRRTTIKLLLRQVRIELSMAVGLAFCSWASMCSLSPNRSARRVLRRLFSSSPPAALLGLSCQDAQRGAESRAATCGCRESCCCASPKKSPPLSARFTHRRLTANIGMNPQPLPVHHPMRSLLCQMCHISVGMSPFQLVKRRHESRVR